MEYKKILLILPDAIGDFLLVTPFLEQLKKRHPHMVIGVVASPRNSFLARKNKHIDIVHQLDVRKRASLMTALWGVWREQYDLLADLWLRRFSFTLRTFVRLSGIKHKVAIEKKCRFKAQDYKKFYHQTFPIAKGQVRLSYNNILHYLRADGVTENSRLIYHTLAPEVHEKAQKLGSAPRVVLVCEGSRTGNTLPIENCVEIVEGLLKKFPGLTIF